MTTQAMPSLAMTPADMERARRLLMRRDPVLGALIKRVGPCRLGDTRTRHPFVSLVRAITSQQLSMSAAATIFARVVALAGGTEAFTSARLLELAADDLRAAGLSRPKITYLRDLAERVEDGRLDLHALEAMSDDEVADAIVTVKGLGRWSADMFLMFRLNRPDVLPVGDLGIAKGLQKLWGMRTPPKPVTMIRRTEIWRPYRSVASWYVWRIHE